MQSSSGDADIENRVTGGAGGRGGRGSDEWIKKLWYIYTMECYSAIKRNPFESVLMSWMNLESIIRSEVNQKEKDKYRILMHIYRI